MSSDLEQRGEQWASSAAGLPRLCVERFDYAPAALLLRLAARAPSEIVGPARPELLIERDATRTALSPLLSCFSRTQDGLAPGLLWRASFAVELDLESEEDVGFCVRSHSGRLFALPTPDTYAMHPAQLQVEYAPAVRGWPYAVRRTALMLIVSCQFTLAPGLSAVALAAGAEAGSGEAVTEKPSEPPSEQPGEHPHETVSAPPPAEEHPTKGATEEAKHEETKHEEKTPPPTSPPTQEGGGEHEHAQQPQPVAPTQGAKEPAPAPKAAGSPPSSGEAPAPAPGQESASVQGAIRIRVPDAPGRGGRSSAGHSTEPGTGQNGAGSPHGRDKSKAKHHAAHAISPHTQATPPAPQPVEADSDDSAAPPPGALSEVPQTLVEVPSGVTAAEIEPPAYLIPIYKEAGRRYNVPWRVLAAINQVETDYGRDLSVSTAGAVGWMQFMPETWQQWAVEADGDQYADPYSPRDAIFTAARYLQASGAEHDISGAIFAYNHAAWYVAEVLFRAQRIDTSTLGQEKGYALPLAAKYMSELGRTDDGVDIETAPDGAVVYSITPGIVTAVAADPGGFGPNYPVIEATAGPLAGQHVYYGHVAQALVTAGQHVAAGEPIAIMGHTGDAVSLGHGHIEIGFSDAGGDPLSHHGASAWTPSGEIMREFLTSLSAVHKVHAGP